MPVENKLPLSIRSRSRFAVVGPGVPNPAVILSSGEDVGDLIGYYSVREAGLADAVDLDVKPSSNSFLRVIQVLASEDSSPAYQAIDVWFPVLADREREELYSLIFDGKTLGVTERSALRNYGDAVEEQLKRLIIAFREQDDASVQYIGQMLATFVTLLAAKSEVAQKRNAKRRGILLYIVGLYAAIVGIVIALALFPGFKIFVH